MPATQSLIASPGLARRRYLDELFLGRRFLGTRRQENAEQFPNLAVFAFDTVSAEVMVSGRFERTILDASFTFLGPFASSFAQGAALDVGANIGNHAIYFAEHFAEVHAIEASELPFALLEVNAKLYGRGRVRPICKGLSDKTETLAFIQKPGEVGSSYFAEQADDRGSGQVINVATMPGDDLLRDIAPAHPIRLIKVDVEGFELRVLRGLEATIQQHRPIILLEQLAPDILNGTSEAVDYLRDRCGYTAIFHADTPSPWRNNRLAIIHRMIFGEETIVRRQLSLAKRHYPLLICLTEEHLSGLD